MPRKNRHVKHTPFVFENRETGKTRFPTKLAAEKAAERQMLLHANLHLYVYKSDTDGGWYLTRNEPPVL